MPDRHLHLTPALLDDAELTECEHALGLHLRSAHRELLLAHLRDAALVVATLTGVFFLFWLGPATVVDSFHGRSISTAWDVILWWLMLATLAAVVGALGVSTLGRRIREVRRWRHRSGELAHKLAAVREEQRARALRARTPRDQESPDVRVGRTLLPQTIRHRNIHVYPRDGFSRIEPSSGTPTDGSLTEFDTGRQVVRSLDATEAS